MAKKGQVYPGKPGEKVPRGVSKVVFEAKHQTGDTVDDWDKKLRAEVPGKRRSATSGKVYYEYRANRSDKDQKSKL